MKKERLHKHLCEVLNNYYRIKEATKAIGDFPTEEQIQHALEQRAAVFETIEQERKTCGDELQKAIREFGTDQEIAPLLQEIENLIIDIYSLDIKIRDSLELQMKQIKEKLSTLSLRYKAAISYTARSNPSFSQKKTYIS